jgi:hypothetical protein
MSPVIAGPGERDALRLQRRTKQTARR